MSLPFSFQTRGFRDEEAELELDRLRERLPEEELLVESDLFFFFFLFFLSFLSDFLDFFSFFLFDFFLSSSDEMAMACNC